MLNVTNAGGKYNDFSDLAMYDDCQKTVVPKKVVSLRYTVEEEKRGEKKMDK